MHCLLVGGTTSECLRESELVQLHQDLKQKQKLFFLPAPVCP